MGERGARVTTAGFAGALAPFMTRAARSVPTLSREEEFELARRWAEEHDRAGLHRLVEAHMRLVIALARRYRHYGLPLADLVQEGHVGLMEAAARFEASREVRFSTYASWWIRAALQDYVLRNWSIVRGGTSSGQKALFFNLRRLRAQMEAAGPLTGGAREAMHVALAGRLGVTSGDVARMDARLGGWDVSLDAPLTEGEARLDLIPDEEALPDEQVAEAIDGERRRHWLSQALRSLNEREMRIISARRLAEESETLEVVGAKLGISKERVRQIENRAIEKLREFLTRGGAMPAGAAA